MSYLLTRALAACNLLLAVILLTIVRISTVTISVVPSYASSNYLLMPVTTRSQAKKLQNSTHHGCSITSSLGSSVIQHKQSSSTLAVSNCNLSTTTSFPTGFPSSSICNHVNDIDPDRSIFVIGF
jgi:hypothetical protein